VRSSKQESSSGLPGISDVFHTQQCSSLEVASNASALLSRIDKLPWCLASYLLFAIWNLELELQTAGHCHCHRSALSLAAISSRFLKNPPK
jgi:hypothetical protein